MLVWRLFHNRGIPQYLSKHYWWAYLWQPGVWFFDHQPIINLILFGFYRRIVAAVLRQLPAHKPCRMLQIASAYGELLPALQRRLKHSELHLLDVAPVQLRLAQNKVYPGTADPSCHFTQMNSEEIAYRDGSFDIVLIFLLLHELPPEARRRTLEEAVRVLKPGGKLIVAEYGRNRGVHFLHRIAPLRRLLTLLEPFLATYWRDDLTKQVSRASERQHRNPIAFSEEEFFSGFYAVTWYKIV